MTDSDKIALGIVTFGLGCYVLGIKVGMRYADPVTVTSRSKDLWIQLKPEAAKKVFDAGSTLFLPATPLGDLFISSTQAIDPAAALKLVS